LHFVTFFFGWLIVFGEALATTGVFTLGLVAATVIAGFGASNFLWFFVIVVIIAFSLLGL